MQTDVWASLQIEKMSSRTIHMLQLFELLWELRRVKVGYGLWVLLRVRTGWAAVLRAMGCRNVVAESSVQMNVVCCGRCG